MIRKYIERLRNRLKYGRKIDEDCYAKVISREQFVVTYNNRQAIIYIEPLIGEFHRCIYIDKRTKWLPPYDSKIVPEKEYRFIIDALVRYFNKSGEKVTYKDV